MQLIVFISKNSTPVIYRQKFLAFALLLCFGVLTGFSPLLHNHDLDLSESHEDCASCLWSQSTTNCDVYAPSLSFDNVVQSMAPGLQIWHPESNWKLRIGVGFPLTSDRENDLAVYFQFGNHFDWGHFLE